jgi:asparagine synthase (glutamine-hydrolysing)
MLFSTLGIIEKSNHKTVWDNIYILPAGSYLEFDGNKYKLKEYYSIIDDVDINEYKRLDKTSWRDVCEEFDTLLNDAVRKMLISDAPMGAYVSGGVDSSLISSYAIKYNNPFKLFTANVLGRHSEYKDAVTLASHLKQELVPYDFHKEFAFRDWAKVCWHYESPIAVHFNAIPFSNVSKLAHEHSIKAVLTGEGADELFLGYPKLLTRKYKKLVKFPFTVINSIYNKIPGLKQYLNPDFGNMGLLSFFELGVQGFRRQMVRENQIDSYYFLPEKSRLQHYVTAQMMQEGIRALLWRNDRMGMIYSIESRFPFLDENIVRFAMNLPIKFKIGRSSRFHNYKHPFLIDKAIVRKTASTYLPQKLVYKKKNGFPTNGLRDIKIRPKFFYDSTTADLLKLNNKQVDYMCQTVPKYHISLLGAFEIWAKLFVHKYSMDKVTEQINNDFSFD